MFCSPSPVDRSVKRRQVKPLAASLLDTLDYDSSDDSDFEVGDASGELSLLNVVSPPNETNLLILWSVVVCSDRIGRHRERQR